MVAVALFSLFAAGCAELDPAVLYRCEPERACLQAGFSCWSDGYCRPTSEPVDSGSGGGGGGANGGGGGAIGGGGGAIGGGGGGAIGGGGGGGGTTCTPCPATFCGYFDAGCGEAYCGGCAAGTECGVARQNRCDTPRLCTQEGWCFENPLPQGNTIRGAWVAGPREVYFVGDNATALLWNGEHHSVIALPAVGEEVDFFSVHGTASNDIFIVGSRGTILHFDGVSWTQEPIELNDTPALRSVWARDGGATIAVGLSNNFFRRQDSGVWADEFAGTGPIDLNDVTLGPAGRMYALGTFRFAQPQAGLLRERDAGVSPFWDLESRPPLINGNSSWVSPDGGFFIAGVADAGATVGRVGMILRRSADAGWDEVVRVPDELRVVRGFTSDDFFAAGDNGLFVHVIDGGARLARLGSTWNALAPLAVGPMVEGQSGQVARFSFADGGLTPLSAGATLNVNAMCGSSSNTLFGVSQGTPNCTGAACAPLSLERATSDAGARWNQVPRVLLDTSEFVACGSFFDFRWILGDDTPFLIFSNGFWDDYDLRSFGRTRNTAIWVESGARQWITNSTQPPPTELPFVTRQTGSPFTPVFRAVTYDGGGDLITVMGGAFGKGWALGQGGLAFTVASDGGLDPAPRLGTEDFVSLSQSDLRDGGSLAIAATRNGGLYLEEGAAGFVFETALNIEVTASWVGERGDVFVVGADIADGGRRQSRVFRKVGASWVSVPLRGAQPVRTVWGGTQVDGGGPGIWVGGAGGVILRRDP